MSLASEHATDTKTELSARLLQAQVRSERKSDWGPLPPTTHGSIHRAVPPSDIHGAGFPGALDISERRLRKSFIRNSFDTSCKYSTNNPYVVNNTFTLSVTMRVAIQRLARPYPRPGGAAIGARSQLGRFSVDLV
jgi:hypothetical protein